MTLVRVSTTAVSLNTYPGPYRFQAAFENGQPVYLGDNTVTSAGGGNVFTQLAPGEGVSIQIASATNLYAAGAGTQHLITNSPVAPFPLYWFLTGTNITRINTISPTIAQHFFNTSKTYAVGAPPGTQFTVPHGFGLTQAIYKLPSYAAFASDVAAGSIDPRINAVGYDNENWTQTPDNEQDDPTTYMSLFTSLAATAGYKTTVMLPGRSLASINTHIPPPTTCQKQTGETLDAAYLRCAIPTSGAASHPTMFEIQSQSDETVPANYAAFVNSAMDQVEAIDPSIIGIAGITTTSQPATGLQLYQAALSVLPRVKGFYMTISSGDTSQQQRIVDFLTYMQTAGY